MLGPYSQGGPADEPPASAPLPEGEHPDPFVVAEEFRDTLDAKYPKVEHTPGST